MEEFLIDNDSKFRSKQIRNGFIKKVYTILSLQLFITFGSIFYVNDGYNLIMYNNHTNISNNANQFMVSDEGKIVLITSIILLFFMMIPLFCYNQLGKIFPINYLILFIFTICMSYIVSYVTIFYTFSSILLAFGMTFLITLTLTIYACQTKYDFTNKGGYLLSILIGIIILGILNIFIQNNLFQSIIAAASAILFSCYIVYDTQLIVGGNHKYQFEVGDHVFATITLYLDIINLFMNLLQLLGKRKD